MLGPRPRPTPGPRPQNPLRNQKEIRAPTPLVRKATQNAATKRPPVKRLCPNKECSVPKIIDGVCHNCGSIVDDSNIVAEISFSEDSRGAAVVQGSYVGEEQGGTRNMGPSFKRAAASGQDRENTIREGKILMQRFANQLHITESVVNNGLQIFKLAATANFIQGRRMDMVAAVCLYTACRKEKPCRIMLIDFSDKVQVAVHKLGHTYKELHKTVTVAKDGIMPVLPEDLIYRFANKMQFGEATHRVAEDACRMVQRMSFDWMVMGRRPAGVCGACLILAARMNNFRRTVHQVVYIVKVTSNTINKRLDEFKETASSKLTVSEFLSNQLLESAHDPPSFYEKNDDFIKNRNAKKRKRKGHDALDLSLSLGIDLTEETGENQRDKRQKSSASSDDVELRRDADGFVIPQQPVPAPTDSVDEVLTTIKEKVPVEFVQELGSQISGLLGEIDDDDDTASTSSKPDRSTKRKQDVHFPSGFGEDKPRVQGLVSEVMFDPNTQAHADAFEKAQARSSELVKILTKGKSPADIPDDHIVGEDEFANDKEVENALFTPAEHEAKKLIWFNENKSWLKKQQAKEHAKAKAANGPPKATRNRKKKPRIGEGQTSAASSPGDAAVEALKKRSWSKKLNYEAIRGLWDPEEAASHPIGSIVGSSNLSRVSSRNGSTVATSATSSNSDDDSDNASSPATSIHKSPSATSSRKATSSKGGARDGDGEEDGEDDDEMGDENDYIDPEENDDDDFHNVVDSVVSHAWKKGLKHTNAEEQENEEDDEDDYANDYGDGDDYQDIGDGGLEDLDLGVWGQDNDDDGDGDEYDD